MWVVINVSPMWYTIYANKKSKPDSKRDANYKAFVRIDYDNWSYWKAIITHFFFWPRNIIGWLAFFLLTCSSSLLSLGHDPYNLPEWRSSIIRFNCTLVGYFILACGGVLPRRERVSVDYSKYLGPDNKVTYDGAGIHISTHCSGFDAIIHWCVHSP